MGAPRVSWSALVLAVAMVVASRPGGVHAAKRPRYFVQDAALRITAGSTLAVPFHRPNKAGSLVVAYVVWDNADGVVLADTHGDTYVSAAGPIRSPDGSSAQVFYAVGVPAGANTVSAQFATPIAGRGVLYVHEYAGLDRVAPLDAAVTAAGSSAAMDGGPLTTTHPDEFLFVAAESNAQIGRTARGYKRRLRKYGNLTAEMIAATPAAYRFTATQTGTSWSVQTVAFTPSASTSSGAAYPLEVGADGRHLVDQRNVPFLLTGDSPQALIVNLSEAEADAFFADRQAAGFNAVWINLLCATYTGGRPDGSTYDGIVPFTTPDDLSTPNEAYFARVDDMLRLAAQHGLVVLLDPAETGSFLSVLQANGTTKARNYGRYLGTRYRNVDNIVWMSGNDFQSWPVAGDDAVVQAVARGIHDTDDRHLHTVELDYPVSGSLDDPGWAPLIELNASYTYYPTYAQVLADYDRPTAIPTFLVEANYEFEHNAADPGTPQILRRQEYWSLLSGAAGQLYGNHWTWPFLGGWQSHLDTPGSQQMGYVKFLFQPRRWYDLVPDQDHGVVTAGYGTFTDSGALADSDYLTAARTPDGALAMAYMPTSRTITVDMTRLAAPANASWYDPSNGTFTPIAGSPLTNAGTRTFTPPGANADGDGDWVLVLDAGAGTPDTQPPSVPAGLAATSVTATGAALVWGASTDDVGVAGYRIYRDGVQIRTTPSTSFTDTGLAPSTSYSYTVAAFDYANNASAPSAPLVVTTPSPGPTLVQQGFVAPQSPQSAASATYAQDQSAGNIDVVAIGWNDTTASIVSVQDTAGNAYAVGVATFRGNGLSQAIYYAPDIVAAAGGTNAVTVTFDRPATFVDLRITEYAGVRRTGPFVGGASASGTGSLATTGAVAAGASDLLFAAGMTGAVFTAPGSGFTAQLITTPDGDLVEDAVAASAGSHAASASLGAGTWLLQLGVFAPAGP